MSRTAQLGIAVGALGAMLTLMGLFPGITGLPPTPGIGLIQVVVILTGFTLLIFGGLIYVKYAFYAYESHKLAQQLAIRLAFTGLVFAAMTGLADVLGFGSNPPTEQSDMFIGPLQMVGMIGSFLIAALGVLLYALLGGGDDDRRE